MKQISQLKMLRREINEIDDKLIKIVAKRFKVTDKIKDFKIKNNLLMEDNNRELQIMRRVKKQSIKLNLNYQLLQNILRLIINEVKRQ